ncbi:hypothetical protein B0H11DRAFT_2234759 [Mycena galericulata]|nr:hypothetical protein B0H11DRAFT_2234759 [Mycena galericulata]
MRIAYIQAVAEADGEARLGRRCPGIRSRFSAARNFDDGAGLFRLKRRLPVPDALWLAHPSFRRRDDDGWLFRDARAGKDGSVGYSALIRWVRGRNLHVHPKRHARDGYAVGGVGGGEGRTDLIEEAPLWSTINYLLEAQEAVRDVEVLYEDSGRCSPTSSHISDQPCAGPQREEAERRMALRTRWRRPHISLLRFAWSSPRADATVRVRMISQVKMSAFEDGNGRLEDGFLDGMVVDGKAG